MINQYYLRQCVIDVFCSTSTERSRKSSSLLLTCQTNRGRDSDVIQLSFPFDWVSEDKPAVLLQCIHPPTTTHRHTHTHCLWNAYYNEQLLSRHRAAPWCLQRLFRATRPTARLHHFGGQSLWQPWCKVGGQSPPGLLTTSFFLCLISQHLCKGLISLSGGISYSRSPQDWRV